MGVSGIELFFKRYFGNFDFNVRYCGIIFCLISDVYMHA